ncbi:kinase-like protein [Lentinus tigrinus ALCF2SS1-7]|uniref:non-specific serine/threonine protein kinase n=1 Tax=Lentinus tigrinus ALCF2SS1-6 TaxID=1328759 RepID=A0A5C2RZT7_9APHY|nr:kinase-like protein [Lentinus tigrinus ALCF2SS1-6]RPD79544.1 kinase-like protein [Lentinus tigrinus ALCF2SS1-7]
MASSNGTPHNTSPTRNGRPPVNLSFFLPAIFTQLTLRKITVVFDTMVFVQFFAFIKKSPVKPNFAVEVAVEEVKVVIDAVGIPELGYGEVHVRLEYDDEGNEVVREVEHLKVSPTSSVASTLVGSPTCSKSSSLLVKTEKKSVREASEATTDLVVAKSAAVSHTPLTTAFEVDTCDAPSSPFKALVADLRILAVLGQGSWGVVYAVQHRHTKQIFALKRISKHSTKEDEQVIFFREQYIQKQLAGNPGFVGLVASWEDDRFYNLLMDFCHGGDLQRAVANNGTMEEDQVRHFAAHLVVALVELRQKRIHHRDIKPENIFVAEDKDGNFVPVIGDFGLAYQFGRTAEQQPWRKDKDWVTKEDVDAELLGADRLHAVCGTPAYYSPEIWAADETTTFSYETDVWAFAVTVYYLLHAQLPFGIDDAEDVASAVLHNELVVDDSTLSPEAVDFLHKALHRDQAERLTMDEFRTHAWFDGFDWDEVEMLEREHAYQDDVSSNADVKHIVLEEPYEDGEEPHPWFTWISPEFQAGPTQSTSTASVSTVQSSPSLEYTSHDNFIATHSSQSCVLEDETGSKPHNLPNDQQPTSDSSDSTDNIDGTLTDAFRTTLASHQDSGESSVFGSPVCERPPSHTSPSTLSSTSLALAHEDIDNTYDTSTFAGSLIRSEYHWRSTSRAASRNATVSPARDALSSLEYSDSEDDTCTPFADPYKPADHRSDPPSCSTPTSLISVVDASLPPQLQCGPLSGSCASTSSLLVQSRSQSLSTHSDVWHVSSSASHTLTNVPTHTGWWGRFKSWLAGLQVTVSRGQVRVTGYDGGGG